MSCIRTVSILIGLAAAIPAFDQAPAAAPAPPAAVSTQGTENILFNSSTSSQARRYDIFIAFAA